jgi:uncharacterized protein YkwD
VGKAGRPRVSRTAVALCAAAAALSVGVGSAAGRSSSTPPKSVIEAQPRLEKLDVRLLNRTRSKHGARAVRVNRRIRAIAEHQARRMARRGELFHNQSLGADLTHAGICWRSIGENAGYVTGRGGNASIRWIHRAYMSEGPGGGHYENVVNRDWEQVGVGVVKHGSSYWETEDFVEAC